MIGVRAVRRDDRDDLGADREGGAAAGGRAAAGAAGARRASASTRPRCSPRRREQYGEGVLAPGKLVSNPLDAISLGMALMFGTAGLPHILMRFYTVPDARAARTLGVLRDRLIGLFYLLTFMLGFGAMVLVGPDAIRAVDKGGNMAAPLLAELLGGTPFLGFIAAVAFATILAVVAGLTLSGAAALSHDLWVSVVRGGHADAARAAPRGPDRHAGARRGRGGARASRSRARTWPSWCRSPSPSRRAPTSRRWCSRSSGAATPRPARSPAWWPAPSLTLLLIYLSPTIQVDILKPRRGLVPAQEPGAGHHAALVPGRHRRVAAVRPSRPRPRRIWPSSGACTWAAAMSDRVGR